MIGKRRALLSANRRIGLHKPHPRFAACRLSFGSARMSRPAIRCLSQTIANLKIHWRWRSPPRRSHSFQHQTCDTSGRMHRGYRCLRVLPSRSRIFPFGTACGATHQGRGNMSWNWTVSHVFQRYPSHGCHSIARYKIAMLTSPRERAETAARGAITIAGS